MTENPRKRNLIEEWRQGRLESSKGILTFIIIGALTFGAGTLIQFQSDLTGFGISLTVIGVLVLLAGVAAKA